MDYAWEKVERIFHTALEMPVERRKTFLQTECADEGNLREEVESLLNSLEKNSGFLDEPVFEMGLGEIGRRERKDFSGQTIGFYKLEEKIGAGGMGEVYRAVDTRLNRRVALKFLSNSFDGDRAARRRLVKEAQAAAALEHQNICAVHGIEEQDEHHFIVMQYVEGKTLDEIAESEKISVNAFKSLARQILTAVAFAHSHGVIHRDLKPGNIMLTPEGQIKVLDFGLARQEEVKGRRGEEVKGRRGEGGKSVTSSPLHLFTSSSSNTTLGGMIIGTVAYMSPEQLRGEKADFRSDIFSLGIVLYELLAGKNPFSRKSQAETIAAILAEEVEPLQKFAPDFPENLRGLVEKCLNKDAENRFQSAAEILVELDNAEDENYRAIIAKSRPRFFLKAAFVAAILIAIFSGVYFYNLKYSRRTLAVLPISIEQGLSEKEYLADGLTQGVIEKLSNLSDLDVKSESLITRYKGKAIEPRSAGKELNVDAVFVGTLKSRADGLVLESKIIRISDGFLIDAYESPIEETKLVRLPENIASRIISKIQSNLTDADKTKLAKKDTESEEAKNLYLQGRYFLKRRKGEDIQKAIDAFTQAKDIDQNYAKAWAGLADAYISQSSPGVKDAISPEKAVELAKPAANKAVELDNTLSEAYSSLGSISSRYEWKWREAENYFRMAIDRDPKFLPARFGLINVLGHLERYDEAMEEAKKIKEYDPLSISSDIQIAIIYYRKRDYEQTDKILSDLLKRSPDDMRIKYVRVYQFLKTNRFKEAAEIIEPLYKSGKNEDKVLAAAPLGFAYAKMGRRDEALKIIEDLKEIRKNIYVPAQEDALIYVGLGDYDMVFQRVRQSCREKFQSLPNWVTDPIVDEIKSDARFAEIKSCVKL